MDASTVGVTTVDDDAYQIDVDGPSYDDPVLRVASAATASPAVVKSTPVRSPEKPANEPKVKKAKDSKPAKEPKVKKVKPAKTPKPPRERSGQTNRRLAVLGAVIGTLGLLFSVILASGALLVALDVGQDQAFFDGLSTVCDALVGPLKNLFTFTGDNAANKQSLVGWGLGSMGYLLMGRYLQSLLQSRAGKL